MANLPTRNNNPGDLRDPSTGNFRVFASPDQGFEALKNDLQAKMSGATTTGLGPQSSLTEFASKYAPASDGNNPVQYANNLASQMGVTADTPIGKLDVDKFAGAVAKNEGYQGAADTTPQKLSMQQFAEKIKSKYPQYASIDDNTLSQKILSRYPQYRSSVVGMASEQPVNTDESLGSQLQKRGTDAAQAVGLAGQGIGEIAQGKIGRGLFDTGSGALQTLGAAAGGVGDVIGSALGLIPGVKQAENLIGKGVGAAAQTAPGQAVVGAAQDFSQAHPEVAKDIGSAFNIAGLIGGGVGAKVGKDAIAEGVGQAAREGAMGSLIQSAAQKKAVSDALEVVAPKETAKTLKQAFKSGRAESGGFLSGGSINPDAQTIRAAQAAAGIVNKSKDEVWNANALRGGISKDANELTKGLNSMEVTPIVHPEELNSLMERALNEIGENPTMVGNAAESAQRIFSKFQSFLPQQGDITASDLLDARKKLDRWISALPGGGSVFDPAYENAKTIALRAIRQGANDLVATKAPDVAVKELLAHQSALYDALENVAAKGAKNLGKTRTKRFSERHPYLVGGLKTVGKGALIGAGFNEASDLL